MVQRSLMSRKAVSPPGSRSPVPMELWRIIADALQNERALDVKYRATSTALPQGGPVPNYKVMKQLALQSQLSWFYPLIIALGPLVVLLAVPWQWLILLAGAISGQSATGADGACWVFSTTAGSCPIINAALDSDPQTAVLPRCSIRFRLWSLGAEIGWSNFVSVARAHLRWLEFALTRPNVERRDLLLHGHDSLALLALATLASRSGRIFITDDHYQRWAHVLSHTAEDFRIVQHGFLDDEIVLPHLGGTVTQLYLRDILFRTSFERYYTVVDHRLFSAPFCLVHTPLSGDAVLLASSFPSIDEEIRLLDTIRATGKDLSIIVKFHPVHRYDSRREDLAARAALIYEGPGNPCCRVFVSYGSFMEFDYRRHGIATVSIARSGGVEAAAEEIRSLLAAHTVQAQENKR